MTDITFIPIFSTDQLANVSAFADALETSCLGTNAAQAVAAFDVALTLADERDENLMMALQGHDQAIEQDTRAKFLRLVAGVVRQRGDGLNQTLFYLRRHFVKPTLSNYPNVAIARDSAPVHFASAFAGTEVRQGPKIKLEAKSSGATAELAFHDRDALLKKLFNVAAGGDDSILSDAIIAIVNIFIADPEQVERVNNEQPLIFCDEAWNLIPDLVAEYPDVHDLLFSLATDENRRVQDFLDQADIETLACNWVAKQLKLMTEQALWQVRCAALRWARRIRDGDESYLFALRDAAKVDSTVAYEFAGIALNIENEAIERRVITMARKFVLAPLVDRAGAGDTVAIAALTRFVGIGHPDAESRLENICARGNHSAAVALLRIDLTRHERRCSIFPPEKIQSILQTNGSSPDFLRAFAIFKNRVAPNPDEEKMILLAQFVSHLYAYGVRFEDDGKIFQRTLERARGNSRENARDYWRQHHRSFEARPALRKVADLYDALDDMMKEFVPDEQGAN